jgi:flagellar motor switch protein FliN/FliY
MEATPQESTQPVKPVAGESGPVENASVAKGGGSSRPYYEKSAEDKPKIQRATLAPLKPEPQESENEKIDYIKDVDLEASVELGDTVMTVEAILALGVGSIVELKQTVGEEVTLLINGHPYARGEVVVINEKFGIRITRLLREAH